MNTLPDFIHVTSSDTEIARLALADDVSEGGDHVDAIQIIPKEGYSIACNRPWYAASEISDISVCDCVISSRGNLQGITCFDGMVKNLSVYRCAFYLNSSHFITLNGLLSGKFKDLHGGKFKFGDNPVQPLGKIPVKLGNLRIGGVPSYYERVEVVGFSSSKYSYAPVDIDDTVELQDNRSIPVRMAKNLPQPVNLDNFDVDMFRNKVIELNNKGFGSYAPDAIQVCRAYQYLAKQCGDIT